MERIDYLQSLFSGASQTENFKNQRDIFPMAEMTASAANGMESRSSRPTG